MTLQPLVALSQPTDFIDCNCACADIQYTQTTPLEFDAQRLWRIYPDVVREPVVEGRYAAFISPAGNGVFALLDQDAEKLLEHFATPQSASAILNTDTSHACTHLKVLKEFVQAGLITPWPAQAQPTPTSRMLTAWLHLTDACNLRCPYCFVQHNARRMHETVGKRAVDATFRAAAEGSYTTVKLKYAGGEPTLVFDLVQTLHRHAQQIAQRSGIVLRELLLSNGVRLTDAAIQYLYDEAVDVMISLDGVGAWHDRQRPTVQGDGTFAAVAAAIDRCLAHGVKPDLSITVTAQNADGLAQAVEFALERNLRFNLNFVRSHDTVASTVMSAEDAALIAGVREALRVIQHRLPPYRLIDGLLDRSSFHGAHEYACGAGRNYLAIGPDGRVARCHAQLDAPVGGVDDPRLLAAVRNADAPGALCAVGTSKREGCATCRWRSWCGGGCSLLATRVTGAWEGRSPYCTAYRALYPEVLRTEGLRLLKYAAITS